MMGPKGRGSALKIAAQHRYGKTVSRINGAKRLKKLWHAMLRQESKKLVDHEWRTDYVD